MSIATRIRRLAFALAAIGLSLVASGAAAGSTAAMGPHGAVSWAYVVSGLGGLLTFTAAMLWWFARQALSEMRRDILDLDRRMTEQEGRASESMAVQREINTHLRYLRESVDELKRRAA